MIELKLSKEEVEMILAFLATGQYGIVKELIEKIQAQLK